MHHPVPLTAAQTGTTMLDASPHLVGMLLVMITLALLWGICALTAFIVKTRSAAPPKAAAPQTENSAAMPPETLAVIAAAVNTSLGKEHKIVSIKAQDKNWEQAGRQAVITSHKIR
jgi:hypothetical protein